MAKRRRWPFLLLSALLIGGLLVSIVAVQALVNQTSFKMRDLQERTNVARQEYSQLRLRVADLSTPERIAARARLLGLQLPDARGVRVLPVRGAPGWVLGGVDAPPGDGAPADGARP